MPLEGGGAVKSRAQIDQEVRERAYSLAVDGFLPLETQEIRELLERLKETQEAIQTPVGKQPDPTVHVEAMSLDPSSTPPTVKLATGNVTSLTIFDSTGEPWPVQDLAFGGRFDIKTPEPGGHIIRITPLETFARGNLSVRLMDFKTPLSFILEAGGEDEVHYRFDAQVPEMGPYADVPPVMPGGISMTAGDKETIGYLTGSITSQDSKQLAVDGADARTKAWRNGDTLYLRTPHTMLSPTWESSASSADGMTVYRLADTPVVLLSDKGKILRVRLKDKDVGYDR